MKSLDKLTKGKQGFVYTFEGSRTFLSRVTAMGFTPNEKVSIIRNDGYGPILVAIRDTEVALGRGEAAKIMMKEENCEY